MNLCTFFLLLMMLLIFGFIVFIFIAVRFCCIITGRIYILRWWLCIDRPKLTNLHPDELCYYPFMISSGRYDRLCNTVEDPSSRICVPNETEDVNWNVWNIKMITEINESKAFLKHISCNCRCKSDGRRCN